MPVFTKMGTGALVAVAAAIGAVAMPATASAQGFIDFLWGGDAEWGGKRQVVSFSQQFKPGQIVVSFGDRRLYLITKPGQAISYPIAVPREQSRWQGVLPVTDKRENPAWTPTAEMLARKSAPPELGAGRPSDEPAGRARPLPRLEHLSHSWNGRALDDRPGRLQGLHPHVQRGRAGPLSARSHRHESDRDVGSLRHVGCGRERVRDTTSPDQPATSSKSSDDGRDEDASR